MFWFKCAMEAESIKIAIEELGKAGAFEVIQAVSTAMAISVNPDTLNEKDISRLAGVKIDRAKRLLPYVIAFLNETKSIPNHSEKSKKSIGNPKEISEKSGTNPEDISEKSIGNLPDSYASNPDGSTRVKSRVDNSIEDISRVDNNPCNPQGENSSFEKFWSNYPEGRKVGKKKCLALWKKDKLDSKTEKIIENLELWKSGDRWKRGFICDPHKFLYETFYENTPEPYKPDIPKQPFQVHSTALPGNQITPAHKRQSGLINLS